MAVVLLARSVCFAALTVSGLRKSRKSDGEYSVKSGETVVTHAAAANCFLTSGYSVQKGCSHSPAVEPLVPCANLAEAGLESYAACIETVDTDVSGSGYKKFAQTQEDWDSMTSLTVKAEGGGYGVSGSASVDYLKSSKSNSESIAFFTGSSIINRESKVVNHTAMKALATPKSLMAMSPSMFASVYGLSYVAGIFYGGSFIGSFQLNQNSLTDKSELSGMIQLGLTGDAFSGDGSAEFQRKRSALSTSVSVWGRAAWKGGSGMTQNYSSPAGIEQMFNQWQASVKVSPTQLKMYARRWVDVAELMNEFLKYMMAGNADAAEWLQKLQGAPVAGITDEEIGVETLHLTRLRQTVEDALLYPDTTAKVKTCLRDLDTPLLQRLVTIEQLDEFKVEDINRQLLNGDKSFFKAAEYEDKLNACIASR